MVIPYGIKHYCLVVLGLISIAQFIGLVSIHQHLNMVLRKYKKKKGEFKVVSFSKADNLLTLPFSANLRMFNQNNEKNLS